MGVISGLACFFVGLVALEHIYILVLEMFLWTKPRGRKAFGMSEEQAKSTAVMAANQGLYNGFLAAGLLLSFVPSVEYAAPVLRIFFLSCVVIAGIYGGYSVNRKIFFIQSVPAILGLIFVLMSQQNG